MNQNAVILPRVGHIHGRTIADNFKSKSIDLSVISTYIILALYRAGARMLSKRCNALSLTFYRRRSRRVMMVLVEAPLIKFLHQHPTPTSISTGHSP